MLRQTRRKYSQRCANESNDSNDHLNQTKHKEDTEFEIRQAANRPYEIYCHTDNTNLTPHGLLSACPMQNENMMCTDKLQFEPIKQTADYFRNPCLDLEKIVKTLNEGVEQARDVLAATNISQATLPLSGTQTFEEAIEKKHTKEDMTVKLTESDTINIVNIESKKHGVMLKSLDHSIGVMNLLDKTLKTKSDSVMIDRFTQTLIPYPMMRNKDTIIDTRIIDTSKKNKGTHCTQYELYDAMKEEEKISTKVTDKFVKKENAKQFRHQIKDNKINHTERAVNVETIDKSKFRRMVLKLERLLDEDDEQIVKLDIYRANQIDLTGEKDISVDIEEKEMSQMKELGLLWKLHSDILLQKRTVVTIDGHPRNKGLFAVGYNSNHEDYKKVRSSLVCIWNICNHTNPERIYFFSTSVVGIEFCTRTPNYLAVLLDDGTIYIVNVNTPTPFTIQEQNTEHIVATNCTEDRQVRAVFVTWFNHVGEEHNIVMCCKENGDIVKQELRPPNLIRKVLMKMSPKCNIKEPTNSSFFVPLNLPVLIAKNRQNEDIFYLVNEQGEVLKMSQSLKNCLRTFKAHDSLITWMEVSPFCCHLLLTASIDGTVKIWCDGVCEHLIALEDDGSPVLKAEWNPLNPTGIISLTHKEIQVWDFAQDKSLPLSRELVSYDHSFTDFVFSSNKSNICVGDDEGNIYIFKIARKTTKPGDNWDPSIYLCQTVLSLSLPLKTRHYLKRLGYPWTLKPAQNQDETMKCILVQKPIKNQKDDSDPKEALPDELICTLAVLQNVCDVKMDDIVQQVEAELNDNNYYI